MITKTIKIVAGLSAAVLLLTACGKEEGTISEKGFDDGCWTIEIVDDDENWTEVCVSRAEWDRVQPGDTWPVPAPAASS